jgi:hypothetical protein
MEEQVEDQAVVPHQLVLLAVEVAMAVMAVVAVVAAGV